ncbi:toll/interleukin-1 receptor domain-containing protein [Chloroflexota bacterium]
MPEAEKRKSAFISYSHSDGKDFTSRLVFALNMYVDVFWDRRLQADPFPPQLFEAIEENEYFIFIMTPNSLESKWCKKEVKHARKNSKKIIPVRRFEECVDEKLADEYTYADFSANFDQGFQDLTRLIFGESYSSWEFIGYLPDDQVIACLQKGLVPGLITKEIIEWVIVEKLWFVIENFISNQNAYFFKENPHTVRDVRLQLKSLIKQFEDNNDVIGFKHLTDALAIVPTPEVYANQVVQISDTQYRILGETTFSVVQQVKGFYELSAQVNNDPRGFMQVQKFFDSDIAGKIRELIKLHARRSKYLY